MSRFRPGIGLGALALLAGLALPAPAATPRDDLLRLVPADVGFCLVVTDLRGHADRLLASPWFKALRQSPLVQAALKSPEAKRLVALEARVRKRFNIGLEQLCRDLLGDAVVFAFHPGTPEAPQEEYGLVLLWARDHKLLAQVIEHLNADAKQVLRQNFHNVTYFCRVEKKGTTSYYYLDRSLLAYSSRKEKVEEVIGRWLDRKNGAAAKQAAPVAGELRQLGADKALAALWLNPRAFEPHVKQMVRATRGPDRAIFETFHKYWKALEGAALAVSVGTDLQVKLAIRAQPDQLPVPLRRFLNEESTPSSLWQYFPADALVTVAGRVDFVTFAEFLRDFVPAEARQVLAAGMKGKVDGGLDPAKDILPYLGPDWGFCITAPADRKILVPAFTYALRVRPGPKKPGVDRMLVNGMNSLALLAVFSYNGGGRSDTLRLRSMRDEKVTIKYLENDKLFPVGFKPAFALKEGYLVLASSPEAVRAFGVRGQAVPAADGVLLVRVSLRAWSDYLKVRREALAGYLMTSEQLSRKDADQQLDGWIAGLSLFDRLELNQRTGQGRVTWTLTLNPAAPK